MTARTIQIGSRVRYAGAFLRSIQCYSGDIPALRGTIVALKGYGPASSPFTLATIQWDGESKPSRALVDNLEVVP